MDQLNELQVAVKALREAGWTELQIANEVGCNQSTINRVKAGKHAVSYNTGVAILQLVGTPPPTARAEAS
ncbi:helix-turn-helix transcriptional regulator [Dyella sp. AtDHG13]|uniref:helix-turn-helix domain-containing protein n=1 Tax=Dyella sp. AtDHG13 TaxID=1938897 RepID=UPI0011B42663|nr:helix-turn-helix transcriptional regulator [Dyella sp. AtDHG13]